MAQAETPMTTVSTKGQVILNWVCALAISLDVNRRELCGELSRSFWSCRLGNA